MNKLKSLIRTKWFICLAIYLIGLAITLVFSLTKFQIVSDSLGEFQIYWYIINSGNFPLPQQDNLLSTSLATTWFPAFLQRLFHSDPVWTFKLYSCFITPILPVMVYLIAQKYFNPYHALFAPAFIMAQHYFIRNSSFDRFNIALVFLSLAVWIIVAQWKYLTKVLIVIPALIGVVISHYGTAFVAIFFVGFSLVIQAFFKPLKGSILLPVLAILIVVGGLWYYLPNKTAFNYGKSVVIHAVTGDVVVTDNQTVSYDIMDFSNREEVLQVAFGKGFMELEPYRKTLFIVSWATILITSLGLLYILLKKGIPLELRLLSVASYVAILLTILLPTLSREYGIVRVWFTGLSVLSLSFVKGLEFVSEKVRVNFYAFSVPLMVAYSTMWAITLYL